MDKQETFRDAFDLLCGEKLGEGIHRAVYECKLRPDLVVKVEYGDMRHFANVFEQQFWDTNSQYKEVSRWLAPCEFLSPDGRLLLQRRCDPVPQHRKMPDMLPGFLTDHKRSNFGLLHGRLVCVDYAITISNPSVKMQRTNFHE